MRMRFEGNAAVTGRNQSLPEIELTLEQSSLFKRCCKYGYLVYLAQEFSRIERERILVHKRFCPAAWPMAPRTHFLHIRHYKPTLTCLTAPNSWRAFVIMQSHNSQVRCVRQGEATILKLCLIASPQSTWKVHTSFSESMHFTIRFQMAFACCLASEPYLA